MKTTVRRLSVMRLRPAIRHQVERWVSIFDQGGTVTHKDAKAKSKPMFWAPSVLGICETFRQTYRASTVKITVAVFGVGAC